MDRGLRIGRIGLDGEPGMAGGIPILASHRLVVRDTPGQDVQKMPQVGALINRLGASQVSDDTRPRGIANAGHLGMAPRPIEEKITPLCLAVASDDHAGRQADDHNPDHPPQRRHPGQSHGSPLAGLNSG
jgi:hypothetical protein